MADAWTVDKLLKLTRRLARALNNREDSASYDLRTAIFQLDRCLIDIRKNYPPTSSLLWIDDVAASLESALRFLKKTDPMLDAETFNKHNTTTITTTTTTTNNHSTTRHHSKLHKPFPDVHTTPIIDNHSTKPSHHHSTKQRRSTTSHRSKSTHSFQPKRPSLASLFSSNPLSTTTPPTSVSRSVASTAFHSTISERFINSFSKFLSPSSSQPTTPRVRAVETATRTVREWISAVQAAREDQTLDDADSWISLNDALPPVSQQYFACRDNLYQCAKDALLKASVDIPPSVNNDQSGTTTVALVGPHGVGKTMLAIELVQDVELSQGFADGVAWIQLGSDINDEELADQIIKCVETIIAGDFRSSVRYCSSLETLVSKASRLLRQVSSLVVIDDVSGPRAQRAFDIITAALGPSSVALYTAPVDRNETGGDTLYMGNATCVAKLFVRPLERNGKEAASIFRSWLHNKQENLDGSLELAKDQKTIIGACHGLPLPLAMSAGYLSKFQDEWNILSNDLADSSSGEETVYRMMKILQAKGGSRLTSQFHSLSCIPHGIWISLSTLADIWNMDYKTVKMSARRLGRMSLAEYRLSDSSDDSRVRFHWQILRYCKEITSTSEQRSANRRLLSNMSRRVTQHSRDRPRTELFPWWAPCYTDKYLCRRLHWHMANTRSECDLRELVCDYQWVCQRLEKDGLIGIATEMKLAISAQEKYGRDDEEMGMQTILSVLQEAAKLRKTRDLDANAIPTFLVARLQDHELTSKCCRDFLISIYEKARRPWLKPIAAAIPPLPSTLIETVSSDSWENEAIPYVTNCLTSTNCGKVVCGDKFGNIHVQDPSTGTNVASWSCSGIEGSSISKGVGALASFKEFIVSGHFNGNLYLRSIRSGQSRLIQEDEKYRDKVTCITTSNDGIIAVGCMTGKIYVLKRVHDLDSNPRRINLEGYCDAIRSLYLFGDGNRLASSSQNGFATIWNLGSKGRSRVSLNGHKSESGHRENYITTFASIGEGKFLLSSCQGGVVNAWNTETGECKWTKRYGYEFSTSESLRSFGNQHIASLNCHSTRNKILQIGSPYLVTRGERPCDLVVVAAGKEQDILTTVTTEQLISTWLEIWHTASEKIYVAVSHSDGRLSSYELVTSL